MNKNAGIIMIQHKTTINFQMERAELSIESILAMAIVLFVVTCPAADNEVGYGIEKVL
ncbi:MAG: hypothetical protein ACE5FD_04415 [Anaerolineae bacterium]